MFISDYAKFLGSPLRRFRSEADGVAAIEGAVVLSMLAGVFVSMADVSVQAYTQNKLSNALRASVQYIANEGKDLGAAKQLFLDSYGSESAGFSTVLQCSCPQKRSQYKIDTTQQGQSDPQIHKPMNVESASVQDKNGAWGQCKADCGGETVVKYLKLSGNAKIRKITQNELVEVTSSYSVRVE